MKVSMLDYKIMEEARIDYKMGIDRFAGKENLFEKYLFKFLEDEHFDGAMKAYEEKDNQQLLEMTHALKGITGMLGMDELFNLSSNIVKSIRENQLEDLDIKMAELKKTHKRYYDVVKSMEKM